jgi:hypothetical protein
MATLTLVHLTDGTVRAPARQADRLRMWGGGIGHPGGRSGGADGLPAPRKGGRRRRDRRVQSDDLPLRRVLRGRDARPLRLPPAQALAMRLTR